MKTPAGKSAKKVIGKKALKNTRGGYSLSSPRDIATGQASGRRAETGMPKSGKTMASDDWH